MSRIAVFHSCEHVVYLIENTNENRALIEQVNKERVERHGLSRTAKYPSHDKLEALLKKSEKYRSDELVPCEYFYYYQAEF